jgi:hypothetical protein
MILSLPNHGTDWLCGILAKHGRGDALRYYHKEFFNPICNPKYAGVLEGAFGCELASCYRNIGIASRDQEAELEAAYNLSWQCEHYNFDKENFSAMKVPFFARHFQLAFLYRTIDNVFPPSRLRVWAFYDAIYTALAASGVVQDGEQLDLEGRALVAHAACWGEMRRQAELIGAPILEYEWLCKPESLDELLHHLSRGWMGEAIDVPAAAAEILESARYRVKGPAGR